MELHHRTRVAKSESILALALNESLPAAVGAADVDWASKKILDSSGKPVGTGRIRALAAILEAYGVLSNLAAEDRCRLITDIVRLPETKS